MKILVACEESGTVTTELLKLGHDAWSCDILPTSGNMSHRHIQGDVVSLLSQKWDMIIAFPPCTYLSNAGACRLYPQKGVLNQERYHKGLQAKSFFMQILNADCPKIAIENPVSSRIFEMPQHSQEIQPYQFYGENHPYTKKTRLWLKGLPLLVPVESVEPIGTYVPAGTGRKDKSKYGFAKRGDDSKNRSKTFVGIAKAMAQQWT